MKFFVALLCCTALTANAQTRRQLDANDITTALGYAPATVTQVTTSVLAALGTGTVVAKSNQFYSDQGAHIVRFGDRLFVGSAVDNPGAANRDTLPRDWLSTALGASTVGAWPVWGAQFASLATYGTTGILGASRTSDGAAASTLLGYTPASIGVSSWGIADAQNNPTTAKAWAFYGEGWRLSNVNYQPTFAMELEGVNRGGNTVGTSNPYHVNNGGGVYGLQLGCGGGQTSGLSPCDAALTLIANGSTNNKGIVIGSNAVAGTDGSAADNGFASAIELGRNQALQWRTPETSGGVQGGLFGLFIRSTVAQTANATRWEATDQGFAISNNNGQPLFGVYTSGSPVSALHIEAGAGSTPAGLYVNASSGVQNLGLFPATGGALATTATLVGTAHAIPANIGNGFLKVIVNGTAMYVPLFTQAQTQ